MKTYTGIGSRSTPTRVCSEMREIAMRLADLGYALRSGGADGADKAFLAGAFMAQGAYTIYVPWQGFNDYRYGMENVVVDVGPAAMEMAKRYHPAWDRCTIGVRKLHARNCYQVLGASLNEPTDFIVCWTPNGARKGGTGQALRIAEDLDIKIFDLALIRDRSALVELIDEEEKAARGPR